MTYDKKVGIRAKIIFFALSKNAFHFWKPKFLNFGTPTQMWSQNDVHFGKAKLIPK